jgi:hypothetical protein
MNLEMPRSERQLGAWVCVRVYDPFGKVTKLALGIRIETVGAWGGASPCHKKVRNGAAARCGIDGPSLIMRGERGWRSSCCCVGFSPVWAASQKYPCAARQLLAIGLSLSLYAHTFCVLDESAFLSLLGAISMRREGILCCGGRSCRLNDAHGKVRKVRSTQASSSRRSHVQRSPHFASLPLILPPFLLFFC